MFRFSEVAVCRNAQVQKINLKGLLNQTSEGDLSVLIQLSTGMLLFKMGQFQYGINPNDKIVYQDKDPDYKLMLCLNSNPESCWIVKINNNVQLIHTILSQKCRLISKGTSRIIVEQIQQAESKKPEIKEPIVNANYYKFRQLQSSRGQIQNGNQRLQAPLTTSMLLLDASRSLEKGLYKAGQLLNKGFQILGRFLTKKASSYQNLIISQQTRRLINNSLGGKLLEVSSQKFQNLFRMTKIQTGKIMDKLHSIQNERKINYEGNQNNYQNKVMNGLNMVENRYNGYSQGHYQAGKKDLIQVGTRFQKDSQQPSYKIIEEKTNNFIVDKIPQKDSTRQVKQQFNPRKAVIKKL